MTAAQAAKPLLHVEVILGNVPGNFVRADVVRDEVAEWLSTQFLSLHIDQQVDGYDQLLHSNSIKEIRIVDCSDKGDSVLYELRDVQLDVQAYTLHGDQPQHSGRRTIEQPQEEDLSQARIKLLPHSSLNAEWDSLVFDEANQIPARLLRFLTRMVTLAKQPTLNLSTLNWNRLVLLHGPPGTGKSTLCRALAQKLTIRLGKQFTIGKLVEVNTHTLLSKWFSESGKLVNKMFDTVHAMAEDESTLICVLLDEVESLAGSRERSASGVECVDGLRATNQLLTALDRIRQQSNIVVFCTSNLLSAIDPAFLDRVDIKQYIPNPCATAAYNILRSCLNELLRAKLIAPEHLGLTPTHIPVQSGLSSGDGTCESDLGLEASEMAWELIGGSNVPSWAEMNIRLWNQPQSSGRKLWAIAQKCAGMSGRTLRRLPFLAITMYTHGDICALSEAIEALEAAVDRELQGSGGQKGNTMA